MKRAILLSVIVGLLIAGSVYGQGVHYSGGPRGYPGVTSDGANGLTIEGSVGMAVTASGTPAAAATVTFAKQVHSITIANDCTLDLDSSTWPASGIEGKKTLYITNGGAAVVTWDGVIWQGGVAPSLTAAGKDVLVFSTIDGGTTVYGFVAALDVK